MSVTSAGLTVWLMHGSAPASALDTFKSWTDAIGTVVTALAVLVGGGWAYFKFARGRTFRPRLEIEMSGQWLETERGRWPRAEGRHWLQARIRVRNIGASKVALRQAGTGLRVRVLADDQSPAPDYATWAQGGWRTVLENHAWIEPGETISDDLLLSLGTGPVPVRLDARVIISRKYLSNIEVNARQVLPADAKITRS